MDRKKAEYLKELLDHCGCPTTIEKSAVDAKDLLRFLPIVGGGIHGVASPEHGASRGETMTYEGLGGGIGGLLGLLGGATVGQGMIRGYNLNDPEGKLLSLAALLGSGLGTAVGTIPGRWLAKRDVPEQADLQKLKAIVEELKRKNGANAININLSSGMPAEADKETGSE